jgi:hypothetical protein
MQELCARAVHSLGEPEPLPSRAPCFVASLVYDRLGANKLLNACNSQLLSHAALQASRAEIHNQLRFIS